jgi:hypothetical protein
MGEGEEELITGKKKRDSNKPALPTQGNREHSDILPTPKLSCRDMNAAL